MQESICKAIASAGSLKNPDYLKTWLYRIVVNTSLDSLRKQGKVTLVDEETLTGLENGKADDYERPVTWGS